MKQKTIILDGILFFPSDAKINILASKNGLSMGLPYQYKYFFKSNTTHITFYY